MEDEIIIELFWNRNEQALKETDIKYGSMCMALAKNIVSDMEDAKECVNDTYLGLWNSIPPTRPLRFASYIAKTVRNISLKKAARNSAKKRSSDAAVSISELEECLAAPDNVEEKIDAQELADCIQRFLKSQDYESRNIFLRRYWFFDSIAEISERFNSSESKVKSNLFRTRNKLKKHLMKEGYC